MVENFNFSTLKKIKYINNLISNLKKKKKKNEKVLLFNIHDIFQGNNQNLFLFHNIEYHINLFEHIVQQLNKN